MKRIILPLSLLINVILIAMLAFVLFKTTNIASAFISLDPNDFETDVYTETISKFEYIPLEKADVVFMGDSIVGRGLWNEYFNDVVVANRGVGTDTTFGMVNRVDQVVNLNPKKIFILGGINDLTNGHDIVQVKENYESIIHNLSDNLPNAKIYVQSILPIQEDKRDVKNSIIESFNLELENISDHHKYSYIDLYSHFIDDEDQLKDEFTIDGTHLTGLGYAQWIDLIDEYVYE